MKTFIKAAIILTYFAFGVVIAQSQQFSSSVNADLSNSFIAVAPLVAKPKPQPFVTKFTVALFTADAVARSLDGYSTVRLLSHPCKCYHEMDPIAPNTGNVAAQIGFQAGALAAVYGGAWLLNKHGHHKMAKMLMAADIASESYAVQMNLRRHYVVYDSASHRWK